MFAKPWLRISLVALAAFAIPACHDDDDDDDGAPGPTPTGTLGASMSGGQEEPPVVSQGRGTASFTVSSDRSRIDWTLGVTNLANVTMAHVHNGAVGVNGGIMFNLSTAPFTGTLSGFLTAVDLQPTAGVATFDEAVNLMLTGGTYANVHTTTHPNGEIRGQIGPAHLTAALSGGSQVPPVTSSATGNGTFDLNGEQTEVHYSITANGFTSAVTGIEVHAGAPGVVGLVLFVLPVTGLPGTTTGTVTAAQFQAAPTFGIHAFNEAVDAMLSGNAYVVILTGNNPAGEIRGQILGGTATPPTTP